MLIYKLLIGLICVLYLYILTFININIFNGIFLCLCGFVLAIFLKSYSLFYASLASFLIIAYMYYNKHKSKVTSVEILKIFILNLINISISTYGVIKIMHLCSDKSMVQKNIPFTNISLIELTPIIYISVIYFVIILLILAINSNLSLNLERSINFIMVKTAVTVISIVLIIIFINAILYFVVHNFPTTTANTHFAGNFLKDAIKSNYKLPKAFADCLWFSATTFFTVGYGDMHPVGNIMYLLSMMEMISAYILGIIMVPFLLFKVSNMSKN